MNARIPAARHDAATFSPVNEFVSDVLPGRLSPARESRHAMPSVAAVQAPLADAQHDETSTQDSSTNPLWMITIGLGAFFVVLGLAAMSF